MAAGNNGYWANVDGKPTYVEQGSRMYEDAPYDVDSVLERFAKTKDSADRYDRMEQEYWDAWGRGDIIPEMSALTPEVERGIRTDYWQEGDRKKLADAADQVLFGYSNNPDGEREESSIPLAAYFVPGIGNALFLGEGVKDAATGNHMPGLVDLVFLGGSALGLAGGAYGVGKYLNNKVNPNRVKSARKAIKDYTPREVSGQVFTPEGRAIGSQDWRFAQEREYPKTLDGKPVLDVEAILNGKARR